MANILEYILWRGDLSLSEVPFNSVDNLVLSTFSYQPFEKAFDHAGAAELTVTHACELMLESMQRENPELVLSRVADEANELPNVWSDEYCAVEFEMSMYGAKPRDAAARRAQKAMLRYWNANAKADDDEPDEPGKHSEPRHESEPDNYTKLMIALKGSRRFGDMTLSHYVNDFSIELEKQFAAITIGLGDGSSFVAFRGTDTSIVGWKEDLNMAYAAPVPAQLEATRYLTTIADRVHGMLCVGGHSKGGNLAVYSSATVPLDVQARILAIYNNDGPGLTGGLMHTSGYQRIEDRLHTYIPQSSIVGMLLDHPEQYMIVFSNASSILQHDPFSWQVMSRCFVGYPEITEASLIFDQTLQAWLSSLSLEDRRIFVDTLFDTLSASGAQRIEDLNDSWPKSALAMMNSLKSLDLSTRHRITSILGKLLSTGIGIISSEFKDRREG